MLFGHVRSCDLEWAGRQLWKIIWTESDGEVAPQMKMGAVTRRKRMGSPTILSLSSGLTLPQGRPPNPGNLVVGI